MSKTPFKRVTAMRRLGRAARYLEQEAKDYIDAAKDEKDVRAKKDWGTRASRLIGAARDIRAINGEWFKP